MALRLIGSPNSTSLLNLIKVKTELGISGSTYDTLLTELMGQADGLVANLLGYSPFRCTRRETRLGTQMTSITLRAMPALRIDAASHRGSAIDASEVTIANDRAGILTRDAGFASCGDPSEWSFDYLSGWFLVGDNVNGSISVDATDDSYNGTFPDFIIAGDLISPSGFSNSANNGPKAVVSATTSKIIVDADLVTEGSATRDIFLRNVPPEIERAAMEMVRGWYTNRTRNSSIKSETIDDVSLTYADSSSAYAGKIEADAAQMLGSWRAW